MCLVMPEKYFNCSCCYCSDCPVLDCDFVGDAVRRATAKKAINVKKLPNGLQGECPVCHGQSLGMNFCQKCGQKLSWKDEVIPC